MVLLADHTKWGTVGLSSFANLDEVDVLITDPGLSDEARSTASEHVDRVIVAGPEPVVDAGPLATVRQI